MLPESQPKHPWASGDLAPSQRLSFTKPHIEFLGGHGLDGQGGSLQQSRQSACSLALANVARRKVKEAKV